MKLLLYILILAAAALVPARGTDVGKLIPMEVVSVSESNGVIRVETDTGDWGEGENLDDAFRDMEDTAPGIIYLDTAEYALIGEGMNPQILCGYLKDSVRICRAAEGIPLEGIADYLSAHGPGVRLRRTEEDGNLPVITEENGRYRVQ